MQPFAINPTANSDADRLPTMGAVARMHPEDLLTRREAAFALRKSVKTLERWSSRGIGPETIKVDPGSVFYRVSDILTFANAGAKAAA